MKTSDFEVSGHYYTLKEDKKDSYRSVLRIKRIESDISEYDLVVVMMNPGSSKPLIGGTIQENWTPRKKKVYSLAKPDNTQYQVMRLMDRLGLNHAAVLNLSDVRISQSKDFYKKLKSYESDVHSIFSSKRKAELMKYLAHGTPVIKGWGLDKSLIPYAEIADRVLNNYNSHGYEKEAPLYRHPLPPNIHLQREWLDILESQISESIG